MRIIILCFFSALSLNAFAAWGGSNRGEISLIEVTAEHNFGYRVHLKGSPQLCGNTNTFAYLNKSDSNYDTYVSVLTAAKFAKTEVTIYTNSDSNGYCKIGHVFIH